MPGKRRGKPTVKGPQSNRQHTRPSQGWQKAVQNPNPEQDQRNADDDPGNALRVYQTLRFNPPEMHQPVAP